MSWAANVAITLAAFGGMEAFAWALHRFVMHGFGWGWHRSHHQPRDGWVEKNDLFSLVFASLCIVLLALGFFVPGYDVAWYIGLGVFLYGMAYFVVHDGMVHKRFRVPLSVKHPYLKRLIQAHRLHHATHEREGAVSYGFLYAPPPRELKLALQRAR